MYHTFFKVLLLLVSSAAISVMAQPCSDSQPAIAGPQVVTNNQVGVVYSTASIPGHTYTWTVIGGVITSGAGTSQITVTWGAVGTGTVSVQETIPAIPCSTTVSKTVAVQPLLVAYFYYTNTSCYGDEVSFFNSSVADPLNPIVSYFWTFGDGGTSVLPSPTHTYSPPWNTTYTVRLIITNQGGFQDTIYDAVAVYPYQFIPTASYSFTVPNCLYDAVSFNSTASTTPPGTGNIIHWDWNFGDPGSGASNTSTLQNPTHIFSSPGNFNVSLIITNERYCKDTLVQQVLVEPSVPTAAFNYSSPTCLNNPVFFTDLSTTPAGKNIVLWDWNFGDASSHAIITPPGNPNVSHIYPGLGPYMVQLTITNSVGCKDSTFKVFALDPSPIAEFSHVNECLGDSTKFTDHSLLNNGPPLSSWQWNFGDPGSAYNTSSLRNPAHLFSATGTFNVRLVTFNTSGCPDTVWHTVTIYPKPAVDYTWNVGTQNNEIQFHVDSTVTNLPSIGNMMIWNFGDGTYGYGHNPVHIYPGAGSFDVILTVTDTIGCSNSITHTISVPSVPFAFFASTSPQCLGAPVCFTDLSSVPTPPFGYITRWIWNFGDGSPQDTIYFPNNPNVCHTYSTADTFLVTLYVEDNWGYYDDYSANVIILRNPIANFQFTTPCQNQVVQFTDASSSNGGGNIIAYNWNFGDPLSGINNTSNLQNPTHIFSQCSTPFNVRLIVTNFNNCTDTIIKPVSVHCAPAVDFTYDTACFTQVTNFLADTVITQVDSIVFWTWDFGDGGPVVHDPVSTSHLYTILGTYTVTLTVVDQYGCVNTRTHVVKVNPLPVAAFSWPSPICQNAQIQFTDQSYIPAGFTGYIAKWLWDFGDGTTQTVTLPQSPNVIHQFTGGAFSYNVTLTVWSNDSCMATVTHTVNLIPSPVANFDTSAVQCKNQPVQFTDLSQVNGGGLIVSWNWNFGDPLSGVNNTSTLQNPTHVYLQSGTYTVRLIVMNVNNCSDTITKDITINLLPVADFTADTACLNVPTQFTDASLPNAFTILIYNWDFGDGSPPSALQNPTHLYQAAGIYNVHLTVTNSNGCIKDTTKQVMVNPLPVAAFSYTTPNCAGAPVCYTDLSNTAPGYLGFIAKWHWDFGDGTTQTILFPNNPSVCHTFLGAALSHPVTLTVTTNDSCTATITHTVLSVPSPLANFSFPSANCKNQTVQFTDLSQPNGGGNVIAWSWNFGDAGSGSSNTSTTQNPVHVFSTSGTFTVTLIVTNASNCSDTVSIPVSIIDLPFADFTADTVCAGSLTTFTNLSTASVGTINQYYWQFGDGQTSTNANPTHLFASSGTYNVTLSIVTTDGCAKDTTKPVIVYPKPVSSFSYSSPSCAGDSVHFTDLSSTAHGSIITWVWEFGDGGTTTVNFPGNPNVYHLYTSGGTYNVKLTITTTDGCTAEKINPVVIQANPLANFDFSTTRCEQMPVAFTDLTQANGGSTVNQWLWDFDDPASGSSNTSNVQNPTHVFSTFGNFQVTLTVTNASGCVDTITKQVSVDQAPDAQFSADTACVGNPTVFTDGSQANGGSITSWTWDFGDPSSGTNNTSTLQNPTHIYSAPGTYNVTLTVTNSNDCEDDTVMQVLANPKPQAMFTNSTACASDSTQFTDLSIAPGSQVIAWFWDFGDGGTATIQNPVHNFATAGTYNVMLVVTNLANCSDSVTIPVVVRPTPNAAFTYSGYFCPAGQVDFQDQSQGVAAAIVERYWIFEPGYTSTLVNPTYTFGVTDTTYAVMLIVTDNFGCKDTVVDSVYVKPGFEFTYTNDTVCYKQPTHFQAVNLAAGDSLYSLTWNFGDPNSGPNNFSNLYAPIHLFTAPGTYIVKLRAYNSDNCVDSVYQEVIVRALPEPEFTSATVPCDSVIHFTDLSLPGSGGISSWQWTFGDGSPPLTINAPGPGDTSHVYANEGTYFILLQVTNSYGCTDTVMHTADRLPCISANYLSTDTLFCARNEISFSDSSVPLNRINQWHWIWGDGTDTTYTSYAGTVTHEFANAGTYVVKLIISALVNAKTFVDSAYQQVVIHPTPTTYFSNIPVCQNMVTLFRDTSETYGENISNWMWSFGEPTSGVNDTSTFKNPTHTYGSPGNFDVKLTVKNRFGCEDSLTKTTRVYALPVAEFNNSLVCRNFPTEFYDLSVAGDTVINTWRWNFGDLTTNKDTAWIQDPVYRYKTEGSYSVRLIVKDLNGCRDTVDSTVVVNPSPISAFTLTDNVEGMTGKIQLNNQSTGATIYFWDFGNGQTSLDENPVVTYENDGTYTIRLVSTNSFECSDTTYYKYEVLFRGLYVPNAFSPTNTNLAVRLFKPVGINLKQYHVMVYDNWGHLMWESSKLDNQGRPTEGWDGTYNGELMPQGSYMWKISAMFIDNSEWKGNNIGKGDSNKTMGIVTLIR